MKRIGIYGGTFNPPHVGHIRAAQYALSALELDELLVIPSYVSPGKERIDPGATPEQRLDMTALAFEKQSGVRVLDLEYHRGGVSYTVDTLEELKGMYPEDEMILLMGTDMYLSFLNWHQPERILKYASIGVFCREQRSKASELQAQTETLKTMGATVYLLENPVTEISSTDIRRMLAFRCADDYLDPAVAAYIQIHGLYNTNRNLRNLPEEVLEKAVISLLKPNRVKHVLGCRDTAVRLARHWGTDETDAARAGLLHDITKALDGPLQLTLCQAYGIVLDDFSKKYPKTLHALTGALVAERIFGENAAVVSAIRSHTTGKADMNLLEKIIYVADYMEPNRDFPGVEELRKLAFTDLDGALKLGLEMTLAVLKEQGSEISPDSREALQWLSCK